MKIDLFKLNNYNKVELDDDVEIPEEYFKNTDIRAINNLHVEGTITIDPYDELLVDLEVKGTFILPCAITLDDVPYDFDCNIEENIGNFNNFYNKSKNFLDILPILWENIVLEVPIRVVKPGIEDIKLQGEGWELVSSEE